MKFPNRAFKLFSKFRFSRSRHSLYRSGFLRARSARVDGAAREKREADAPTDVRRT